jgi:hypothetical protein
VSKIKGIIKSRGDCAAALPKTYGVAFGWMSAPPLQSNLIAICKVLSFLLSLVKLYLMAFFSAQLE